MGNGFRIIEVCQIFCVNGAGFVFGMGLQGKGPFPFPSPSL